MPEIGCCFRCAERQQVMRESARLSTEGVPVVSDKCIETKFSLADYQHPVGKVGGLARETLCALCTLPANGDEMLECGGSRDGTACTLVWHKSCHEMWCSQALSGGAAAPPSGDVLQCCTGWAARALLPEFEKDRFCQPYSNYRKELRSNKRPRDPTVDATPPPKVFTPQTLPRAGSAPSDPTAKPATSVATSVAAALAAASEPAALAAALAISAIAAAAEPEAATIGGAVGGAGAGTGWVAGAEAEEEEEEEEEQEQQQDQQQH